jgi:hypothetical protein
MPSAGLEPATPALGRRRSNPLSYEGMAVERTREGIIDFRRSGRSSARLECTVRDREVGGSNPLAPISLLYSNLTPSPKYMSTIKNVVNDTHPLTDDEIALLKARKKQQGAEQLKAKH